MVQALMQRLVLERGLELAVQPQLISVPPLGPLPVWFQAV
jgi:hypothetical protein